MEKKINEKVEEVKNGDVVQEIVKENIVEKVEEQKVNIFVEREPFKGDDGKQYWSYVLRGKIRDRAVKVDFAPKDKGGYEVLDILFDVQDKAELVITKSVMQQSDGTKTKLTSFDLKTYEGEDVYECPVKPSKDSDKALLKMILRQFKIEI